MKQTVNKSMFMDAFQAIRPENFSYEGLDALFDYFEQYEEDCGQDVELDVIAICCDFSEYANIEELKENYTSIEDIDDLRDHTTVIEFGDEQLIIQDF